MKKSLQKSGWHGKAWTGRRAASDAQAGKKLRGLLCVCLLFVVQLGWAMSPAEGRGEADFRLEGFAGRYSLHDINTTAVSFGGSPSFSKSSYTFQVSDDVAQHAAVGTVAATDPEGSSVQYAITAGNTNSTFAISSSGTITTAKFLNHHFQDSFKLTVRASDAEGLTATTSVDISVKAGTTVANFSSITWSTLASQPLGTHEVHGEVVNGKLYIFGGYDVLKQPSWTPTKRSYVYDPATNKWSSIADLPHTPKGTDFGGITHEGLTTDGTDIYFAGGYTSNTSGTGQVFGTKQVWRYNVASNTYTRLPDLPKELAAGQMQYLQGKLHYAGGANLSRADIAEHYMLDLDNLSAGWKAAAPLSNPRNHPGSAVFEGKMYYIGGAHHQDDATVTQKTVEVYDPATDSWSRVADMPVPRDHISSSVTVLGNRILVLGGETSHNVKSKLVSAYDPATNSWTELTALPATTSAGVAGVLNGTICYTGGNFSKTARKGTPGGTTTSEQRVASLTVVNAETDQDLQVLSEGATLNLSALPTRSLNIRANTDPSSVGSVAFQLSGAQTKSVTESLAPYALFGDDTHGDYYSWTPAVGSYTLRATPYSGSKGTGTAGQALEVHFTVTDQSAGGLVSNLSATTGKSYTLADLVVGAKAYTDRTYQITSVPSSLAGAKLVQTANDDKWNTSSALLSFDLSQQATVYVAYDPRATTLPSWLTGWQKLSDKIGVDDSKISYMEVYSKSFAAGKVTLGGNLQSPAQGAQNNYFVLAKAAAAGAGLVSNVSAASGRNYNLTDLAAGKKMYTDRDYLVTAVPALLSGAELIQPANDDKRSTASSLLSFDLSQQATVYVAYDPRATALPTWLSGWQKLSEQLGVGDSKISAMDLYARVYAAGKVTLGGNLQSPAAGAETGYLVMALAGSQLSAAQAAQAQALAPAPTAPRIAVAPNPAQSDRIHVDLENLAPQEAVELSLYDAVGHLIVAHTVVTDAQGKVAVEFANQNPIAPGLYFVNARAGTAKLQTKVVVR